MSETTIQPAWAWNSWRSELPAGASEVGGVRVRRFPVEEERDLDAFNRYSDELYGRAHTHDEEIESGIGKSWEVASHAREGGVGSPAT